MKLFLVNHFLFLTIYMAAQFAPPAGQIGSSAVFLDSAVFVSWATHCSVTRGYQDISVPVNGYANVGDSSFATGKADASGVVSLGDGGSAIVSFASPIIDVAGDDFAVFENSFDDTFLELAFVEVSSNGTNFFRFPATSLSDTVSQTWSFGATDATKINNLAGKYRGAFGTPFDLADIPDHILLDKQNITHVKIIDVVGCLQNQYCSRDILNHKINDPWPTSFGSGGFDLDAVGVIHQKPVTIMEIEKPFVKIFPNPVLDNLHLENNSGKQQSFNISSILGEVVYVSEKTSITAVADLSNLIPGVYILNISCGTDKQQMKFVKL